jgi:hypothetical protein
VILSIVARYKVLTSLSFGAMFGIVSLAIGFGVMGSIASALVGAASGLAFFRRSFGENDSSSRALLKDAFRAGVRRTPATTDIWLLQSGAPPDQRGAAGKLLYVLGSILPSEVPYRAASVAFLAQAAIGGLAILLFWIAQAAGVDVRLVDLDWLRSLFAGVFPIQEEAAIARARFDNLFLPLVSLYAISFLLFVVAFLRALGPILGNMKAHWKFLWGVPLLTLGLWLLLFYRGSSPHSLQKLVIEGYAWGYFGFFVIFPIFFFMLSASLPKYRSR